MSILAALSQAIASYREHNAGEVPDILIIPSTQIKNLASELSTMTLARPDNQLPAGSICRWNNIPVHASPFLDQVIAMGYRYPHGMVW